MKKYIVLFVSFLILFGCSDKQKLSQLEEKNAQLETEYKLLTEQNKLRDQFIEEYTRTINDVYDNLERIRKREGLLSKYSKDLEKQKTVSLREKMLSNIESIDSYLRSSKKQLKKLKEKMYSVQMQTASLEETINKLNETLEEKERYITELKNQVEQLNVRIARAEEELQQKEETIQTQTRKLNTAYYIIADEKELKEKGIIEEKGGIFGIRKAKKLAPGFSKSDFMVADIASTSSIAINKNIKKVKIISPHNPESYHLVKKDDRQTILEIIDPEEFWKIKYLVILTKS